MAPGNTATVIGLGSMGWGAALSLLRAGFHVKGVDIREGVLEHDGIHHVLAQGLGGCRSGCLRSHVGGDDG